MPYKISCFAVTATALIAKQIAMDRKEELGGGKAQESQVGTC